MPKAFSCVLTPLFLCCSFAFSLYCVCQGQAGGAQGGVVTEAEWRAKYDAVKAQLPAYRAMKQELEALEGEVGGCVAASHVAA